MKLIFVLAVTALLVVSTVQGLSFQEKQEILKQVALLQKEMDKIDRVENDNVVATASNGTESSILEELNLNKRVRRATGCDAFGPYGGGGGNAFQELVDDCNAVITDILVRSGNLVDAIQFHYKSSTGQYIAGKKFGGYGGYTKLISLKEGEKIVGVFGSSGSLVDNIGFVTSHDRKIGPFGGRGGKPFNVMNCDLRGIFGRVGNMLDSIGFYCQQL